MKTAATLLISLTAGISGLVTLAKLTPDANSNPSCGIDWHLCINNEDLVNNYSKMSTIHIECKYAANDLAKYGKPEWPFLPFGTYFTGDDYVKTGVVTVIEKDARFQNGFGAMAHSRVECAYDLNAHKVLNVYVK